MAEERETTQIETPEETASGLPIMPAAGHLALAMGLQGAVGNPDLAQRTGDLLAKQSAMLDVQMEDLHEQRLLQISHLRLRRWGEWLSLILRGLSVAGGIAVAFALAVVIWQARNASGIIIAPFSVPPELAATGLTGDVVANRLLDRLAELQDQTDSARAPETFRNAGEDEIRVEIPETGVSLGELLKLLHGWLGHETHISGDVVRLGTSLTVTSRVGETAGRSFTGDPTKLDDLIKQAAETVYAKTQPYRYGVYLSRNGRNAEALEVMKALALRGPERERAWGYIGWAFVEPDAKSAVRLLRRAVALSPSLAAGWASVADYEGYIGRDEYAVQALRKTDYLLGTASGGSVSAVTRPQFKLRNSALLAEATGDFGRAADDWAHFSEGASYNSINAQAPVLEAINRADNHDLSVLDEVGRWQAVDFTRNGPFLRARAVIARATATNDWSNVPEVLTSIELDAQRRGGGTYSPAVWETRIHPWLAVGLATTGRIPEARATIEKTSADCYPCLRARGRIEQIAGDKGKARLWLSRAMSIGPSLPFAYLDLAKVALDDSEAQRALTLAARAIAISPNLADGYEVSGTANLILGRCAEAEVDFQTARRLAPVWIPDQPDKTRCGSSKSR